MPTPILMPALSPTMEEGTLAKWKVQKGDRVSSGDVIAEIETDKATMEVEAVDEGVIGEILVAAGTENVKVNAPIALLIGEDEKPAKANGAARAEAGTGNRQPATGQSAKADEPAEARGAATPTPPRIEIASDPELPAGVEMVPTTVQGRASRRNGRGDAARSRRAPDGRGGRAISGRLQGVARVTRGIRAAPRHRYADHGIWICGPRRRRGVRGAETHRRVHDVELRHAGDRPHHQLGSENPLHVRRADGARRSCSGGPMRRPRASPPSTARISPPGIRTCRASSSFLRMRQRTPRGCSKPPSATRTRSCSLSTSCSTATRCRCRSSTISCCRSARRKSSARGAT